MKLHTYQLAGPWALSALVATLATARPSYAFNLGVEAGAFHRSAPDPQSLNVGWGVGAHLEGSLFGILYIGPYFDHYELGLSDADANVKFNTLGGRARLVLPLPTQFKPYAYVGAGGTLASYPDLAGVPSKKGYFVEVPIGVGVAYSILPLIQLSADVAYRPGFSFGGDAYNDAAHWEKPTSGISAVVGVALDF